MILELIEMAAKFILFLVAFSVTVMLSIIVIMSTIKVVEKIENKLE